MRQNYLSEQIFEWAGVGAAHVRATLFYENVRSLTASSLAKDGTILLPWGSDNTVIPMVSGEDVARVAAGVLTASSVPPGSSYPVIGEVLALMGHCRNLQPGPRPGGALPPNPGRGVVRRGSAARP